MATFVQNGFYIRFSLLGKRININVCFNSHREIVNMKHKTTKEKEFKIQPRRILGNKINHFYAQE